jgi:hypothetical protein
MKKNLLQVIIIFSFFTLQNSFLHADFTILNERKIEREKDEKKLNEIRERNIEDYEIAKAMYKRDEKNSFPIFLRAIENVKSETGHGIGHKDLKSGEEFQAKLKRINDSEPFEVIIEYYNPSKFVKNHTLRFPIKIDKDPNKVTLYIRSIDFLTSTLTYFLNVEGEGSAALTIEGK